MSDGGADVLMPWDSGQDAATVAPLPHEVAAEALFAALEAEAAEESTGGA